MQKLVSKIDYIIISFITWIIAWIIPLTYTQSSRRYRYNLINNYDDYIFFGMLLIPFCLLSSYCSYRILTHPKFKQYIQEHWNKAKEPIFILLFCLFLIWIIPHTGKTAYALYRSIPCENPFALFTNLPVLFLETTFLSTLYMQLYKIFRNKG
ncbi:hypothetical protein CKC_04220 [Candidatus Liberibacter solanacearum CLso-ZC1]|uniref:Transmembrane protein n=1 Tax=Liberibacter solanacearum (strain CLso-ZC1) TaxID=658172 RepID=E4UBB4_LIBSC|nr:hypothetical protein CKC_04220 [Candidatus Liberibacter solanacearum CLso-ZC1]